jgi:hypothetical protein
MIEQYYALQLDLKSVPDEIFGPFGSEAEAVRFIEADCESALSGADQSLLENAVGDRKWFGPWQILKSVASAAPVPALRVQLNLQRLCQSLTQNPTYAPKSPSSPKKSASCGRSVKSRRQ